MIYSIFHLYSVYFIQPNITSGKFPSEGFTICTHNPFRKYKGSRAAEAGGIAKEARPMRSALKTGHTEKEAGPLGRRPGLDQRLDAGARSQDININPIPKTLGRKLSYLCVMER